MEDAAKIFSKFFAEPTKKEDPLSKYFAEHTAWIKEDDPTDIFLISSKTLRFEYCFVKTPEGYKIYKTHPDGSLTSIILNNFNQYKKNSIQNIFKFYDEKTNEFSSYHYLDLDLDFISTKEGMKSNDFSDYYLTSYPIKVLDNFYEALILESKLNDVMVIIPARVLIDFQDNLSHYPILGDPLYLKYGSKPYFIYNWIEEQNLLASKEPIGNLYLVFLFCMLHNYQEAMKYLTRSSSLTFFDAEIEILKSYTRLTHCSPEAIGFYMHLALLVFNNFNQPLFSTYRSEVSFEKLNNFFKWVKKMYSTYLQMIHCESINQIPDYVRLDRKEERRLINNLHRMFGNKWGHLIQVRYDLLNSEDKVVNIDFSRLNFEIDSKPPHLSKIDLNSLKEFGETIWNLQEDLKPFEGRLRTSKISAGYAIYLYEKAKKAQVSTIHPIDLDIYQLTITNSDKPEKNLNFLFAELLRTVRNNPSHFSDLNLSLTNTKQVNQHFFELIIDKAKVPKRNLPSSSVTFRHNHKAIVKLSNLPPLPIWKWLKTEPENSLRTQMKKPLGDYLGTYFKVTPVPSKPNANALSSFLGTTSTHALSSAEKVLIENINKGNSDNLNTPKVIYEYVGSDTTSLKNKLELEINSLSALLQKKKETLENKANKLALDSNFHISDETKFLEYIHFKLRQDSQQITRITLEILVEALLRKDPSFLYRHNYTLNNSTAEKFLFETFEYLALHCRLMMLKIGLKIVSNEQPNLESLGKLFNWEIDVDHYDNPEYLVYMYRTSQLLRPEQIKLLTWIGQSSLFTQNHHRMIVAFPAGGGKSSVIHTILMYLLQRQGYPTISLSPETLYPLDRDNQRHYMLSLNQTLTAVETALHVPLSKKNLGIILAHMQKCIHDKLHLKSMPETYFTFYLLRLFALQNHDYDKVKSLSEILNHFKKSKFTAIIDECKMNLSPSKTTKIGFGEQQPIPEKERILILTIAQYLYGPIGRNLKIEFKDEESGKVTTKSIEDVMQFKSHEGTFPHKYWPQIADKIAEEMMKLPDLNILTNEVSEFKKFWTTKEAKEPKSLENNREKKTEWADFVCLVRGYLCFILPLALSLKYERDYGPSPKDNENFFTPKIKGDNVQSIYEDPYMTVFLTIRGYLQSGLKDLQISEVITLLQQQQDEEYRNGIKLSQTKAQSLWQSWLGKDGLPLNEIEARSITAEDDEKPSAAIRKSLLNHEDIIFWYVKHVVLKEITTCEWQFEATATHLMNAFHKSILFSAYPGPTELYDFYPGDQEDNLVYTDHQFVAATLNRMLDPENETTIIVPDDDPKKIFTHLIEHHRELFTKLNALTDISGVLSATKPKDIAVEFLTLSKEHKLGYDGVVFFEDSFSDEFKLKLLRDPEEPADTLSSNNIEEALKEYDLKWSKVKLLTIYNNSKVTGTHIAQPETGCEALLIDDATIGDTIQGALRFRSYLTTQTSVWIATQKTYEKIKAALNTKKLESSTHIFWALKHEGRVTELEVPLQGYQEIEWHIQQVCEEELNKIQDNPKKQCNIFQSYLSGYRKPGRIRPKDRFNQPVINRPIEEVFLKYAQQLAKKYGLNKPLESYPKLFQAIQRVIQTKKNLVPQIPIVPMQSLAKHSNTFTFQLQQTEQVQHNVRVKELEPALEKLSVTFCDIRKSNFIAELHKQTSSAVETFGSSFINSNLRYSFDALTTSSPQKWYSTLENFKPTEYFLIVKDTVKLYAIGISDKEASHFTSTLREKNSDPMKTPHQVMLVNYQGNIIQNGVPPFGFNKIDKEALLKSDLYQDMMCQAGIINGQLVYQDRFLKMIPEWKDFPQFWERIKQTALDPDSLNTYAIENLAFRKPNNVDY